MDTLYDVIGHAFIDGFCNFFRGEMVQFGLFGHKRQNAHGGRLIQAIFGTCTKNKSIQYIFFTFGSLFVTKSESCCDPYGSAVKEGERKKEAECGRSR